MLEAYVLEVFGFILEMIYCERQFKFGRVYDDSIYVMLL